MRWTIGLVAVLFVVTGCGPDKKYKDDPELAASIRARKTAEKAAAEALPSPYAEVPVREVPAGRILYDSHRGHVVYMHGITLGEQAESLPSFLFRAPTWSPDGDRILVSYFGGETNRFELGVTQPRGGEVTDVATHADHDSVSGAWSPDGRQVAYVQSRDNKGDLAVVDLDSGKVTVLDTHEADDGAPTWSPDGQTIAFESYREGTCAVYAIPTTGGAVRRITREEDACGQPAYSPDGEYLAYVVTYRSPSTREWVRDLRVMKLDSGARRTLAEACKQVVGVDWSPEGQWLVFGLDNGKQNDLCIVDMNGNGLRWITSDEHADSSPSWGPAGS